MTDRENPLDLDFLLREDINDSDFEIPSPTADGVAVNWRTLEYADAPAAWDSLREWVEWFVFRYQIPESVVPVCWYKHGRLVEELAALHTAHVVAFDPSDGGFGPIRWHERLDMARPRLRSAYYGGCSRGHTTIKPRSWANTTDEQEWARHTQGE